MGLIPGLGTSVHCGHAPPPEKKFFYNQGWNKPGSLPQTIESIMRNKYPYPPNYLTIALPTISHLFRCLSPILVIFGRREGQSLPKRLKWCIGLTGPWLPAKVRHEKKHRNVKSPGLSQRRARFSVERPKFYLKPTYDKSCSVLQSS